MWSLCHAAGCLGTCLLLEVATSVARVRLLPPEHPTTKLSSLLTATHCPSCFTQSRALFDSCVSGRELPDLDSCGLLSVSELHEATYNQVLRKMVLCSHRHDVVKPLLLDFDRQHLMESIFEPVPTFVVSFFDLALRSSHPCRLLISISAHGVLCGSHAHGRCHFWTKLNCLSSPRARPLVEKMFLCCACWEDPPRKTFTGTLGIRDPPGVRGGNSCSIFSEILAHGSLARLCRILPSKTVCRRLDGCSWLKT